MDMVFKPQTFYGNEPETMAPETTPPAAVETRVAEALARAGDLDAADVSVTSTGDTIVLNGTVAFPEEIAIAEDIASRIAGVAAVENHISIAGSSGSMEPSPI
jgi:osmotically-inducible protein OsmY